MMLKDLQRYRDRIETKRDALIPDVHWAGKREKVQFVETDDTSTD